MRLLPTLTATFLLLVFTSAVHAGEQQLLELRTYRFESAEKMQVFSTFLEDSLRPALNRAGIKPVGVFQMRTADNPKLEPAVDGLELYVLLPHASMASVSALPTTLDADKVYTAAAQDVLDTPRKDPVVAACESQLMLAFAGCPKVEVPTQAEGRLFQLRIYQSHNPDRALRKIEMFNQGELALFRKVGMDPVFFGQALSGTRLPNLTYMLGFDDQAALDAAWKRFLAAPEWKAMKNDPTFKDTVSNITNLLLRPLPASQI